MQTLGLMPGEKAGQPPLSPRCIQGSRQLSKREPLAVYIHSHFLRFGEPRYDGADMMRTEPSRVSLPGQKSPQALPWEVPGGRYRPQICQAALAASSIMPRSVSLSSCPVCFPARGRQRRWRPVVLPGGAVMSAQPGVRRSRLFVSRLCTCKCTILCCLCKLPRGI